MKVLDAEFVQGYIRMANDGWEQGWHERNGGNLTYRMKPEEVEMVYDNVGSSKKVLMKVDSKHIEGVIDNPGQYFEGIFHFLDSLE